MLLGAAQHLTPYSQAIADAMAAATQSLLAALQQPAQQQPQPLPQQQQQLGAPGQPPQRSALNVPSETVAVSAQEAGRAQGRWRGRWGGRARRGRWGVRARRGRCPPHAAHAPHRRICKRNLPTRHSKSQPTIDEAPITTTLSSERHMRSPRLP